MQLEDPHPPGRDRAASAEWLRLLLCGILIGGGGILPGVSGGVLCVAFGIYRPLMELLAHPKQAFRKRYKMLIPVGAGALAGFAGFARVIEVLFAANELLATWLFIGLIVGTVPSLYREAGLYGRPKGAVIALFGAFAVLFSLLTAVRLSPSLDITPSLFWYLFAGVLWGLSIVVPGMTSSSVLISLGIFQPMTAGIAAFTPSVIIPWLIGMALTVMALAKLVNHLFERRYAVSFHAVVGATLASTLAIVSLKFSSVRELALCVALFVLGFAASILMEKLDAHKHAAAPADANSSAAAGGEGMADGK